MALAAFQVIPSLLLSMYFASSTVVQQATIELDRVMAELEERLNQAQPPATAEALNGFPWGLSLDATVEVFFLFTLTLFVSGFLLRTLALGGTVALVGDSFRSDTQPGFGAALAVMVRHFPALALWAVLSAATVAGLALLLIIPCLGIILWLVVVIFLFLRLLFVPQIIVAENVGVFTAISRSWSLTKHTFGRVLAIVLLFSVTISLLSSILSAFVQQIAYALFGVNTSLSMAISQGWGTILGLLTVPIGYIGFTLFYYDQQRRAQTMPPPVTYHAPPGE